MPELSIIVPVYKAEKYLPKCIDSILAQTFRDFELILVVDGSPDNCGTICDAYAARDARIKVIHQKNAGVSTARNAGLDIASGTYLGFVDSDDWIEPEMYETMIAVAMEKNVDVVVCGYQHYDRAGELVINNGTTPEALLLSQTEMLTKIIGLPHRLYHGALWNKLYRRDRIPENWRFHVDLRLMEDWVSLLELFETVQYGYVIPDAFYHYTANYSEGLSTTTNCEIIYCTARELHRIEKKYHSKYPGLSGNMTERFLDECTLFLARIRNTPGSSMIAANIKARMIAALVYALSRQTMAQTKINKYLYEGVIKS